jgi:hypothetical protein
MVRNATRLLKIDRQYNVWQSVQLLGGLQWAIKGLIPGVSSPASASNQPLVQRVPEVLSSGTAAVTFS